MLVQLNPPLPLETSKGAGWAHFVIDYGPEAALLWVVFMDADGACWTVPNPEVRMSNNWTMSRPPPARVDCRGPTDTSGAVPTNLCGQARNLTSYKEVRRCRPTP